MRAAGATRARRLHLVAGALFGILSVASRDAIADVVTAPNVTAAPSVAPVPVAPPAAHPIEVRLALSPAAAKRISEPKLRRLLEIELESTAVLSPAATGPLGDFVAYVWVEPRSAAQLSIDVRLGDHPVAHREIAVQGLSGDVAARLVALAASELLRSQLEPQRALPHRPPVAPLPTLGDAAPFQEGETGLVLSSALVGALAPSASVALAGPSLGLSFRSFGADAGVFGRWLSGSGQAGTLRWLEVGLGAAFHPMLMRDLRLELGGLAALASVHLDGAGAAERDTWSARAGGVLGVELRIASDAWLGLAFEPGAVLRPVAAPSNPARSAAEGLWLGMSLTLHLERLR